MKRPNALISSACSKDGLAASARRAQTRDMYASRMLSHGDGNMLDAGMVIAQIARHGGIERGPRASNDRRLLMKDLREKGPRKFGEAGMLLPGGVREFDDL